MQLAPVHSGSPLPQAPVSKTPAARVPSAFQAIDDVLDLSSGRRNIVGNYHALPPEEQEHFLDMLATLLKQGVIGKETKEVKGEAYESFLSIGFADPVVRDAPSYRAADAIQPGLDLRA